MNCYKCGKKATKVFSPDLDIQGIGSCNDCFEDVQLAYLMLLQSARSEDSKEMLEDYTKNWKTPMKVSNHLNKQLDELKQRIEKER